MARRDYLAFNSPNVASFDELALVLIAAYRYGDLINVCAVFAPSTYVPAMAGKTIRKTEPCGAAGDADNLPP